MTPEEFQNVVSGYLINDDRIKAMRFIKMVTKITFKEISDICTEASIISKEEPGYIIFEYLSNRPNASTILYRIERFDLITNFEYI